MLEIFEESEETDEVSMCMVQNNTHSEEESPTPCAPHPQLPQEELRTFAILLLALKKSYNLSESCIKAILLLMVLLVKVFMRFLQQIETSGTLDTVAGSFLDLFPTSEHALRRLAGIDSTDCKFNQLVCCPKCFKTYPELRRWTLYSHSTPADFLCDFVEYPRHPHVSRRMKCGSRLLKFVSSGRSKFLRPIKVFPSQSLVTSLKDLLSRPNMLKHCNEWPSRKSSHDCVLTDIYDGQVWQNFQEVNGRPFLNHPNNLGLSLNLDWFRPFKHSPYSTGVIYFAVLNLPREFRYLPENVIIAGIIPGPHEPSKTMNTLLEPAVKGLHALWQGIPMHFPSLRLPVHIRAALICITCDIPACRKLCGFLGHNAHLACSKCSTFFPGSVQQGFDFSGFETQSWTPRNITNHRINANATRVALTQVSRKELESRHGVRYSILLELPYLDIIQQHVIDPMHNLFMGIAKHSMSVWKDKGFLTPAAMLEIQDTINKFEVPTDVGRIPGKIASGFADFTADQWKHWIIVYSLIALKNRLPDRNYKCWTKFVHACILFCSVRLTPNIIRQAHTHIVQFCQEHRVIITDPDNNNKMADVYQPQKTYRIYRAQD